MQILKSKMERTWEDLENIIKDAVEKINPTIKTLNERVRLGFVGLLRNSESTQYISKKMV